MKRDLVTETMKKQYVKQKERLPLSANLQLTVEYCITKNAGVIRSSKKYRKPPQTKNVTFIVTCLRQNRLHKNTGFVNVNCTTHVSVKKDFLTSNTELQATNTSRQQSMANNSLTVHHQNICGLNKINELISLSYPNVPNILFHRTPFKSV
jgi:hypothetical protein